MKQLDKKNQEVNSTELNQNETTTAEETKEMWIQSELFVTETSGRRGVTEHEERRDTKEETEQQGEWKVNDNNTNIEQE